MKYILFIIICFYCYKTTAQIILPYSKDVSKMTAVDSGNIRVWYAFNAADINNSKTYDDLQRLEIGKSLSKYYSFFTYNSDSLLTEWGKKNPNAKSASNRMGIIGKRSNWSEYSFSEYFKLFNKDMLIEYARMPMFMKDYQCIEDIPIQNWAIKSDTVTIVGYLCQKAICKFRGRDFTAWFTMEIPIDNGPWKFSGLPGLILKVYDNEKQYVFECINIEKHKNKYPIKQYCFKSYIEIERERLLKLQKNINEDYFKTIGAISEKPSEKKQKFIYYPLELE
jgi:GLPGLI family protein